MNRKLADKFFANQASPGETRKVLGWFETPAGKTYLEERLDADEELMNRRELADLVPELDSDMLYHSIRQGIRKKSENRGVFSLKRTGWLGYPVKAAAAILVIAAATVFTVSHERYAAEQIAEQAPVVFQTEEGQHREITLGDGTMIRLNSNSEMIISEDFMQGSREITLTGEAYFDVVHDPKKPFIIRANESTVEVLGTSFNVRSYAGQDNVQVAVVEGMVSFKHASKENSGQLSVILSEGQYAYMDVVGRTFTVDDLAVENYLAWKSGRLMFEGITLSQVCTQLNRLYDIDCSFSDEQVQNLQITSNFATESMEKTLEVIALSLNIDYETEGSTIHWTEKN
jgi:transmembrane sensor